MSAIEPAKDGADAEVPPTPKKRNSRAFAAKVKAEDGTVISVRLRWYYKRREDVTNDQGHGHSDKFQHG